MHKKIVLAILLVCTVCPAQSLKIDAQRPSYEDVDVEGLSNIGFVACERTLPGNLNVGVEFGWSCLRVAGESEFALANPRAFVSPKKGIAWRYSLWLPIVDENNPAAIAGLSSQFVSRLESFLPDAIAQRFEVSDNIGTAFGVGLSALLGVTPVIVTGEKICSNDSFELFVPFSLGLADSKDLLSLSVCLEGNYFASEKLTLAEATALQARFEAAWNLGGLSLAGYFVLPVDKDARDGFDDAVGLKAGIGW